MIKSSFQEFSGSSDDESSFLDESEISGQDWEIAGETLNQTR